MHSKGLIHGDINPRNVLLLPDPKAPPLGCVCKLADFGLTKQLLPGQLFVEGIRCVVVGCPVSLLCLLLVL